MRYFTLDSARRLLPQVRQTLGEAMEVRAAMEALQEEIRQYSREAQLRGGILFRPELAGAWRSQADSLGRRLRDSLAALDEMGVQVKDLAVGLVDFPTFYRGKEVLLCWKMGEPDIAWWHGTEEGFRGRKPVDEEFLANHSDGGGAGQA
jgi:hypothetical protein